MVIVINSESFINKIDGMFDRCSDYAKRELSFRGGRRLTVLYIINLCDKKYVTEGILKPLSAEDGIYPSRELMTAILASLPLSECTGESDARDKILSGNAVIVGEENGQFFCYAADAKSEDGRSISEPDSESVVRGPRQGFVENAMLNVTMLRKIIKSERLKVLSYTFGSRTNTDVKVVYYDGIADKRALGILLKRLEGIKMDSCVDSGNLELMLQSSKFNLFSEVGNSEKPDKVASKILGGRIAVICDGSPVVLTVPYLFTESIQSSEDYLKSVYYATFIRILRVTGMILAVLLPAVFVAVQRFHKGALPYSIYKIQTQARSDVPFGIFTEMLIVLLIFEIVREVGVRMPKAVGDALSVVGGLILGDAAIKAGITSETVVVIAALTGICNFMNPTFMNANVILRLAFVILAGIFGFYGIALGIVSVLVILCGKRSFGADYMMPFSPMGGRILYDTVIMKPYAASFGHSREMDEGYEN